MLILIVVWDPNFCYVDCDNLKTMILLILMSPQQRWNPLFDGQTILLYTINSLKISVTKMAFLFVTSDWEISGSNLAFTKYNQGGLL